MNHLIKVKAGFEFIRDDEFEYFSETVIDAYCNVVLFSASYESEFVPHPIDIFEEDDELENLIELYTSYDVFGTELEYAEPLQTDDEEELERVLNEFYEIVTSNRPAFFDDVVRVLHILNLSYKSPGGYQNLPMKEVW